MKTTIKLLGTLFLCTFFSAALFAQDIPGKELVGKWKYTFDHPMEGTINGVAEFAEKEGKVVLLLDAGGEVGETTALRANENGKYYADMESYGFGILLSFAVDGDKIACDMDAGVMIIPMDMEREK